MKTKLRVLYDNTDIYANFDEMREHLFNTYAEDKAWKSVEDIPDGTVYDEIETLDRWEWQDFLDVLHSMFSKDCYILTGTCGKWYGEVNCGAFITSADDLLNGISHLGKICFYDENGHLKIHGYHHDGEDNYEIKKLTSKGFALAEKKCFAHSKLLHDTIMKSNVYSALPYLAKRIYGA